MAANTRGAAVEWNDSFALGLAEIDGHHQNLIAMINDLWRAIVDRKSGETVSVILDRLEQYTVMHFGAEEALMRSMGYPNLDEHRRAHEKFIRQIADEREKHAAGALIALEVLRFLSKWLVAHIQTMDREYAEHFERSRRPRSWLERIFLVK